MSAIYSRRRGYEHVSSEQCSHCLTLTVPRSARVMNKDRNARNFIIADLRAAVAPAIRENPEEALATNKNGTQSKIENDFRRGRLNS